MGLGVGRSNLKTFGTLTHPRYQKHLSSIYFIQRTSATKLQLFGDSDTYIANMANNQYPL